MASHRQADFKSAPEDRGADGVDCSIAARPYSTCIVALELAGPGTRQLMRPSCHTRQGLVEQAGRAQGFGPPISERGGDGGLGDAGAGMQKAEAPAPQAVLAIESRLLMVAIAPTMLVARQRAPDSRIITKLFVEGMRKTTEDTERAEGKNPSG